MPDLYAFPPVTAEQRRVLGYALSFTALCYEFLAYHQGTGPRSADDAGKAAGIRALAAYLGVELEAGW